MIWVSASRAGAMAAAAAARIAERVEPPSRRAKLAVSGMSAAQASEAGRRRVQALMPAIWVAAATRGTSGGWSA